MGIVSGRPDDAILIAVDGGGSKTDGVALDLEGNVIARARMPGSSPQTIDLGPAVHVVDSLIRRVHDAAGGRPLLQTNIYLSGLDLPAEVSAFARAVATTPWATGVTGHPAVVGNDMFALLRAGTEEQDAVAVVCGTGINCIGVRSDGQQARFAALGRISGDWGGGSFLGEQALWHAARAMDGRGDATVLTSAIPAHLGLADVAAVIEAFHFGTLPAGSFSGMAPLVLEASDAGDAIARGIVDRQADEIVAFAVAAMKRLDLLTRPVPVVLGGGVLATGNDRLIGGVEAGLADLAPLAVATLVRSRPILGAALLTLETVGAPRTALSTARAALEHLKASKRSPHAAAAAGS
ncbi:BadF/BadG/BcrA/BcrD ATPase family protein [Microbacterium kribbense]|uniref:BadF/BadG/BcrA/BcrD ATPase family protein n=1 Tax=Microbacterium kribbense TaxID=433645 RepID=A0ABP7GRB4_9MICO